MNRDGPLVGQPSRLSSRASRPRRILGRDAPAAGGTPAPLLHGSWKESLLSLLRVHWDHEPTPNPSRRGTDKPRTNAGSPPGRVGVASVHDSLFAFSHARSFVSKADLLAGKDAGMIAAMRIPMSHFSNLFNGWILGCALAVAPAAWAQTDQQVYTDSLLSGWQNWSWAVVDLANGSPVHSGTRSASVTADAWEAIYLHHDAFDSGAFSDLVFWIHGGSSGGQLLQVQALLSGSAQSAVALPPLPANAWQKITIPLSSLGVANKPNLDGFWIQDRSGATIPTFYVDDISLTAVPPPSVVNISVNAAQTIRTVDARHFGVNAAVWDGVFDTPTTISLLSEMGNQALRFPGGSLSDEYHWQSNTTGSNTWQWATSFDEFAHVATATAAQVFITVNYGSGTPAEAADWVRYGNVTKGYHFQYWEIGNENYGSWETDNSARPHDPYTYASRFKDYFYQMKAVDPTAKIGAVIVTGEDSYANYTDHPATNP